MDEELYQTYIDILNKELVVATGCTEPIALAYCGAKARSVLGELPDKVVITVSGNIIKNVKSVVIPQTNGEKGIKAAVAIGIVAGDENKELEVLSHVTEEQKELFSQYLKKTDFQIVQSDSEYLLDIFIEVYKDKSSAKVRIVNSHCHIVYIEKNKESLYSKPIDHQEKKMNYESLSIENICLFANEVKIKDVEDLLKRQIQYNSAIAQEGLNNNYGANIGTVLLHCYGQDIRNRAKAYAAAGSDARMNGCEMPVVINSGSGNQGITVSIPVYEYAKELHVTKEQLLRALVISNLVAIHIKYGIGSLSAYCGAISAGAAAGAGITYLKGGNFNDIAHTIVNALAITSGIVCDGAKASCAAKIATAIDAGILGYDMYQMGQQFYDGEGIVCKGVENTIRNIGRLGKEGMKETDKEILHIMTCVD